MKKNVAKRGIWVLAILALFGLLARGQAGEQIVSVKVVPSTDSFKPGGSYPLTLEVSIQSPYHINAEQPLEAFLIGTTVDFKRQPGVTYKKITFPPAETKKLDFSENPLAVYEGGVKITAEVELAPDFRGNVLTIEGALGYQACDDRSCLPPASAAFSQKVKVVGAAAATAGAVAGKEKEPEKREPAAEKKISSSESNKEPVASERKAAESPQKAPESVPSASWKLKEAQAPFEGKGLPLMFFLVFVGGLALNLTPCIYPLIPITISYFGGQAGGRKGSLVAHSVLYVIGMAVTYSVLGVIAAFTGSLFGTALQYPPVLAAIALIMVLLSLSMFNVYELRMPAFLNKIAGGSQKGFFGTFLMGLTVGIIAAPCIGPFVLGLLTYVGNTRSVPLGFLLFFVLAFGLGIPFLLLGIFSGSISRLPRSGGWMVWVRTIFGFILIAMAVYFLKTLFPNSLYYSLTMATLMLVAGIYMAWIEPTKSVGRAFVPIRNLVGLVFFGLALYFAASGIQGYLDDEVSSRLRGLVSSGGAGVVSTDVDWRPYSDEALAGAASAGKPVFVDFYTDWCIACKEMDKKTFSDPAVVSATRNFVMLRSNLTTEKDPQIKALYQKYQVRGVPTYVFLAPDGKEIASIRLVGFEPKRDFLPRLKRALELSKK